MHILMRVIVIMHITAMMHIDTCFIVMLHILIRIAVVMHVTVMMHIAGHQSHYCYAAYSYS